ncbi:MAG: SdpI family protein [Dehalococcoidales bacterium]|nr:SdpI family protein [Dehalococcoidales bacterium]
MKLNRYDLIILVIAVFSFIIGAILYPQMPEQMASHWNAQGLADDYTSRFWGTFLMPVISLALAGLLLLVPRIDPRKANIEKFKGYYYSFVIVIMFFFTYIYVLTLIWNKGGRFDMTQLLTPAIGVIFYIAGIMTGRAKRNYFIGIRTPWTLNNEEVWNKTHRLGGLLFKISGVIAVIGVFFPEYTMIFILAPVLATAVVSIVYSYVVYQKIVKV